MPFQFDNSYARLPENFYARVDPTPVGSPGLIRVNHELAAELGVDAAALETPEGVEILAGNRIAPGSEPIAMAYAGHQFGGFVPQLGDGRACILGEVLRPDGERFDIQLKGSGPTPFSRRGDGRSALGPVLREYLVSEAMAALGVPTTRALAAVTSGDLVYRESAVPGGVFTRVARSHIRVGTFQYFAARQDVEALKTLLHHAITRHDPAALEAEVPAVAFLDGVLHRQADLIAHWMQLGFIHGVMNTDNMTVSGETIDYGPCAFMDEYHPAKKFSSIDHQGRYAFNHQGPIGQWNLTRLAETLLPLIDGEQKAAVAKVEAVLDRFPDVHLAAVKRRFAAKIGHSEGTEENWERAQTLLNLMTEAKADFTLTFRHLADVLAAGEVGKLAGQFADAEGLRGWIEEWRAAIPEAEREAAVARMRRSNPVFIPRNHRVEEAIAAGNEGDFTPFHRLHEVLRKPFEEQPDAAEFEAAPRPEEVVCATFCGT